MYLNDNLIEYFPWKCLEKLPSLKHLNLKNNRILTLPGNDDGIMTRLKSLTELDLYPNNHLRCDCDVVAFAKYLATREDDFVARWMDLGCKSKSGELHPNFTSLVLSKVYENDVCYRPQVYVIFKSMVGGSLERWSTVNSTLVANSSTSFSCLVVRETWVGTTFLKISVPGLFPENLNFFILIKNDLCKFY